MFNLDYGVKIPSESQFDVYFEYNTTANRECNLSLVDASGQLFAYGKKTLIAGSNQGVAVTLNPSTLTPVRYTLNVQFFDSKNVKTLSYSQSVNVLAGRQEFYIEQGNIFDANKNNFIMRGVNNHHKEVDGYIRADGTVLSAKAWILDNIASYGTNTVRIPWSRNLTKNGLDQSDLNKILSGAIANKLIPIFTLHDNINEFNSFFIL